jgi:hypothetical protein
MKQLELIHKYGVTAVLILWLGSVQLEMNDIRSKLFDCNRERIEDFKDQSRTYISLVGQKAILPKKIRIEKRA